MTEAAATHFDEAIDAGHGEEDMAAVYQAARPDRG
jgi:3-hydroxyisobutyrate dehydrogenase-like beta-hydroxyacid dehydrogenase